MFEILPDVIEFLFGLLIVVFIMGTVVYVDVLIRKWLCWWHERKSVNAGKEEVELDIK